MITYDETLSVRGTFGRYHRKNKFQIMLDDDKSIHQNSVEKIPPSGNAVFGYTKSAMGTIGNRPRILTELVGMN